MQRNVLIASLLSIAIGFAAGFFLKGNGGTETVAPSTTDLKPENFREASISGLDVWTVTFNDAGIFMPEWLTKIDTQFIAVGYYDTIRSVLTNAGLPKCCPPNPLCCRKVVQNPKPGDIRFEELGKLVFSFAYEEAASPELEVVLFTKDNRVIGNSLANGNTEHDKQNRTIYATAGKPAKPYEGAATILLKYKSKGDVVFTQSLPLNIIK